MATKFASKVVEPPSDWAIYTENEETYIAKPYASPYPTTIVVETMTVCNLKCPTCRIANSSMKPWFMPLEQFRTLAGRLRNMWSSCQILNLCSSEPLLHKNFFEMVDIVKNYNLMTYPTIITNGMLLDEKASENLLKRGILSICVSLDGTTKEVFESIRVGADFDVVIKNLERFRDMGGNVRTIMVVQKKNVHQIMDFVDMCYDLGIWLIKFSGLNTYRPEHVGECLYSYEGNKELEDVLEKARIKARNYGIQYKTRPTQIRNCGCGLAGTLYIAPNGDMMPCVFFSEPQPFSLLGETRMSEPFSWGNVYKDDPVEVWQSKECFDFRRNIEDRDECRFCGLKYGVVC